MRWATFMDSGLIREIIDETIIAAGHVDGVVHIAIPEDVFPVPGKWRYDTTRGFYPDQEMLRVEMTSAIQNRLDDYCVGHGYDSILSAVSYAGSTHPVFGPQGVAARDWRDACWAKGIEILSAVEAGTMVCPTEDGLIELLPLPGW